MKKCSKVALVWLLLLLASNNLSSQLMRDDLTPMFWGPALETTHSFYKSGSAWEYGINFRKIGLLNSESGWFPILQYGGFTSYERRNINQQLFENVKLGVIASITPVDLRIPGIELRLSYAKSFPSNSNNDFVSANIGLVVLGGIVKTSYRYNVPINGNTITELKQPNFGITMTLGINYILFALGSSG